MRRNAGGRSSRRRNLLLRILGIVGGMLLGALVLALLVVCIATTRVSVALTEPMNDVAETLPELKDQVISGDSPGLAESADTLAQASIAIHDELENPFWQVIAKIPVVGTDVSNAQQLCTVLDDLAEGVLSPLAQSMASQDDVRLSVSKDDMNLSLLVPLTQTIVQAGPTIQEAYDELENLPGGNIDQLNDAVDAAQEALSGVLSVTDLVNALEPVLPALLGMDGDTKTYLLEAQGNAEVRSCGGFPGQACIVTASNGHVSIGDFSSLGGLEAKLEDQYLPTTSEETTLFGYSVSCVTGDINMIPDFSRAGYLFAYNYQLQTGDVVDGVVMLDPVVLQRLLGVAGSVTTSNGVVVDGENASEMIQNRIYLDYSTEEQDAFFSEVANLVMSRLSDDLSVSKLLSMADAVQASVDDHRILAWMRDSAAQELMCSLGVDGALVRDVETPQLGVFFDDATYAKIDWYLDTSTEVGEARQNADGTVSYQVVTTMTNTTTDAQMTASAQGPAGTYIMGTSWLKRSASDMVTNVYLFAPYGGSISNVKYASTLGTALYTPATGTFDGFKVAYAKTQIQGGDTLTITYTVTCAAGAQEDLDVRQTPMCRPAEQEG